MGLPAEYETGDSNICTDLLFSFQHHIQLMDNGDLLFYTSPTFMSGLKAQAESFSPEFYNKSDNKLGIPMPKGKIRVYKKSGEELEFVGENSIQHTPRNEKIDFTIGNAFDIRADFQTLNSQRIGEKTEEAEYSIEIRNQKDSEVEVDLLIHFGTYRNWEVLDKNFEFQKKNAGTIIVTPKIKSEGSTILKYKVRFSFM